VGVIVKRKLMILLIIIMSMMIFITACPDMTSEEDEQDDPEPGTLTVNISGAGDFNGNTLYYTLYDSDSTDDSGYPTGTPIGRAAIVITDNEGSAITKVPGDDLTIKTFDPGTYYLGLFVDVNGNASSTNFLPDGGDRYGAFITVTIDGNLTITLTPDSFPDLYPTT
jgi:uncharacterized protein (DUF2141 family)